MRHGGPFDGAPFGKLRTYDRAGGGRRRINSQYYSEERHRGDTPRLRPGRLYDVSLRGIGRGVATLTEPRRVAAVLFRDEEPDPPYDV